MPGRPRKPLLLHKIDGTARKSRLAKRADELQLDAEPERPQPPDWLLPEALAEWDRLFASSQYAACIRSVDRGVLAMWCQLWAKFVAGENGGVEFGGRQLMTMLQAGRLLGLNPQDRCKIKTPDKPTDKADDRWTVFD